MSSINYRPEIDGLRALAVSLVIFFHAGYGIFSGGFIGVDVFFVISGFLITKIIQNDLDRGVFSLVVFYERRARRILPALFVVLLVTSFFAWSWMTPWQLDEYKKSAVATSFFLSNVFFVRSADYFSAASELNPLLHTWSLAVEEQFYIFFPLMMMFCARRFRSSTFLVVLVVSMGSFMLASSFAISSRYEAANFYLLPTRAWELGVGVLLALKWDYFQRISAVAKSRLAFSGIVLIVVSALTFNKSTPFPGPWAVFPVFGAALVIACASRQNYTGRALSIKPMVALGLISYSTYLWHQPVFALFRIWHMGEPEGFHMPALIIFSLFLAFFSYKFIEAPFRWRLFKAAGGKRIIAGSCISILAMVFFALNLSNDEQYKNRYPEQVRDILSFLNYREKADYQYQFRRGTCFVSGAGDDGAYRWDECVQLHGEIDNYLILGDSHAAHLWRAFSDVFNEVNFIQATASGCRPIFGQKGAAQCVLMRDRAFNELVIEGRVDGVILAARWREEDLTELIKTVEVILAGSDHTKVIVLGPTVEYLDDFPKIMARVMLSRHADDASAEAIAWREYQQDLNVTKFALDDFFSKGLSSLSSFEEDNRFKYVSMVKALCDGHSCKGISSKGQPVWFDYGHLTLSGAMDILNDADFKKGLPILDREISSNLSGI